MPKRDARKLEGSHKLGHKQLKNDKRPVSAGEHSPAPGPILTSVTDHTRKTAEELGGVHPQPRIVRGRETEKNTVIYGWVLQRQGGVYLIHFPAAPRLDQHMTPQMVEKLRTGGEPVDLCITLQQRHNNKWTMRDFGALIEVTTRKYSQWVPPQTYPAKQWQPERPRAYITVSQTEAARLLGLTKNGTSEPHGSPTLLARKAKTQRVPKPEGEKASTIAKTRVSMLRQNEPTKR